MTRIGASIAGALVLAAGAIGCGCAKCSDRESPAASSDASAPKPPHISMADQRRLRRGDGGMQGRPPIPEAREMGRRLRQSVAPQCKDPKCFHSKCAPLCVQWLRERDGGGPSARDLYLDCVGFCAFAPDGGA